MKKIKTFAIATLLTFCLAGCQNTTDRESALEDQVAQLEQEVTSLEKENAELSAADHSATPDSNNTTDTMPDDDIESLKKAVDNVVAKANKVTPEGSDDEKQKSFYAINDELQEVENRLEHYEDKIENNYHNGELSFEKAHEAEREIDHLEDKLDDAEDRLEDIFGYDD